jgi:hypothetical protein
MQLLALAWVYSWERERFARSEAARMAALPGPGVPEKHG